MCTSIYKRWVKDVKQFGYTVDDILNSHKRLYIINIDVQAWFIKSWEISKNKHAYLWRADILYCGHLRDSGLE